MAASVLAGALAATACGNTEGNPDSQPMAGRNSAGGAAGSSAGQPQASGNGGRASGGTGQAAGFGGELAGGGGSGGVSAVQHPLLVGDDACPPAAPTNATCSQQGATCVYRGITAGLSETDEPMRCLCNDSAWACVQSDEHGETTCPDGTAAEQRPVHGEPCPEPGQSCIYALLAHNALAGCYCSANEAGEAGGGGAGGAETEPTSKWFCGV